MSEDIFNQLEGYRVQNERIKMSGRECSGVCVSLSFGASHKKSHGFLSTFIYFPLSEIVAWNALGFFFALGQPEFLS